MSELDITGSNAVETPVVHPTIEEMEATLKEMTDNGYVLDSHGYIVHQNDLPPGEQGRSIVEAFEERIGDLPNGFADGEVH